MFIYPYSEETLCQPKPLPNTSTPSGFDLPSGSGTTFGEKLMELDKMGIYSDLEKLTSEKSTKQEVLTDDNTLSSINLTQSHDFNRIQAMTLKDKIESLGSKLIIRDFENVESSSTLLFGNNPLVDPSEEYIERHLISFKERCKVMESVETYDSPVAFDLYSPKRLAIHYNKVIVDEKGVSLTHPIITRDQLVQETDNVDVVIIPSTIQESYNLGLANLENSSKDLATFWEKYKETSMDLNSEEREELDLVKSNASRQQLKGLDYSSSLLRVAIRDKNNDALLKAHELFTITEFESQNTEKLLKVICDKLKD